MPQSSPHYRPEIDGLRGIAILAVVANHIDSPLLPGGFLFRRWDDYFAGQTKTWPLLHTWSLAVEEQFYPVFPGLVFLVAKRSRIIQAAVFAGLFLISFFRSVGQSLHDARLACYLLPSRSRELLAGGLCSLIPLTARLPARLSFVLGLASAGCVVAPVAALSEESVFPGWAALVPVVGTVGLIVVTASSSSTWQRPQLGVVRIATTITSHAPQRKRSRRTCRRYLIRGTLREAKEVPRQGATRISQYADAVSRTSVVAAVTGRFTPMLPKRCVSAP